MFTRLNPKDYCILIVDDSSTNIQVLASVLRDYGFGFEYASSGKEALDKIAKLDIDLVLLDIMMPVMDGFQVCEILRENPQYDNLPILFLTAKADKESIIKGFEIGGQDYIVKPFDVNELTARVCTHLELRTKRTLLADSNQLLEQKVEERTKELVKAREKAEESDRLKSMFLANMSHEIRTPMNGILGFTNLLQEDDITRNDQKEYLKVISDCGKHLLSIINDLVDISRVEAGLVKLHKKPTDVNEQVVESYNFFKIEAQNKGIDLSYDLDNTLVDPILFTDAEKLYALLTNLIKNAIKYTETGSIIFGYTVKDDTLEFYVKDTGVGIATEQQCYVFKRFRQVDSPSGVFQEGNGLGLSIAKAYTEMLGGAISLKSTLGVGSTFFFTLPITRSPIKSSVHNLDGGAAI